MDRLTKKFNGAYATNCDNCPKHGNCYDATNCRRVLVNRLAAYEDTGLEPEEITAIVKARAENRCVVLDASRQPLVWGDDDHDTCLCPDCGEDLMGVPYGERMILQCPACGQYLDATKIVTRTKAALDMRTIEEIKKDIETVRNDITDLQRMKENTSTAQWDLAKLMQALSDAQEAALAGKEKENG